MSDRSIRIRNCRVHNLKGIDLDIPHNQWLAICGLSGSGKSSLAFDTLYAEGQRRYLDCLSPGTRKFLTQLDKPDADLIDGLPPAIAVQAARGTPDRRTTVGNATEIVEHLRLLFSKIGKIVCPVCESNVERSDPQAVANWLESLPDRTRYVIAFQSRSEDFEAPREALTTARRNGFLRAMINGTTISLDNESSWPGVSKGDNVLIVVDRLMSGSADQSRRIESLETAFQFGSGHCVVVVSEQSSNDEVESQSTERDYNFSNKLICPVCSRLFPDAQPKLFSFNHPTSACSACAGVGFADDQLQTLCSSCDGQRLLPDALAFQIAGLSIAEVCQLTIAELKLLFNKLSGETTTHESESQAASMLTTAELKISQRLLAQIETRLSYLSDVGLEYLTLDRPVRTLSSGEAQRVSLTTCLSSTLVNMLYVLDEPTIGLHSNDVVRLVRAVGRLNRRGNTVIVVDHDETMLAAAPRIVEIGPAAGAAGGEIVFDGTVDQLRSADTVTAHFISGRRGVATSADRRRPPRGRLRLTGARGHNLKNIDVEFPLGCLCVVTGVSGAGKSSLVHDTLYGAIRQRHQQATDATLPFNDLFGDSIVDEVVLVDQSPIGRSGRSNPVTYVKAFDDIRTAFAETNDAKTRGIKAGHFSFNVSGGRCEKCSGDGQLTIDMQFLADVYIKCDACGGTRFNDNTLAVRYRGQSIADVLNLTVREAFTFFRGQPKVQNKLKALIDVGLEYIRLGQPATTLSAGEAQRLKLAVYLNASKKKRALFILEEPTTGLHPADVTKLLDCFEALLTVGHSLIVVEHNLQLIKDADWIIDLGPGAAEHGGAVVVAGTPETVAECADSITGKFLQATNRFVQL